MQLTSEQIEAYRRDGFIVIENVLSADEVQVLRDVTDAFVERSRSVSAHDDVFDLEPDHSARVPRVRRIKTPHLHHEVYARTMRHPAILAVLRQLVHPALRFDGAKLNMKEAGGGAAVEWHQDWAFYPHTNDDMAAVGIMMDDCAVENGPLLCIPGTHKGPVYDHHSDGVFCGAIDPKATDLDFDAARPCVGPAGSISVHHVRVVHGSAQNVSDKTRRLLLYQYHAADAWPLLAASQPADDAAFSAAPLCGDFDPVAPRMEALPVRLPLPKPTHAGSIYEIQRGLNDGYFKKAAAS